MNYYIRKILTALMNETKYHDYLRTCGVKIGTGCNIERNVVFGSEPWLVRIGDNVRLSRNVQFVTHDGGLWTLRKMKLIDEEEVLYGPIIIGDNCNISWDVTILPGVTIGRNCVIGAGALVTKNIPEGEVWGGVPAKKIETIMEYYEKNRTKTVPTNSMSNDQKRMYLAKKFPEWFEDI